MPRTAGTALEQRLGQLGWIEGRTIAIERRWADARKSRFWAGGGKADALIYSVFHSILRATIPARAQSSSAWLLDAPLTPIAVCAEN
jgi:hypothetical protein